MIDILEKSLQSRSWRFSVAPMMEWTDRHCRFFHRLLTRRALLYTEMLTTGAVLHGDRARLLRHDAAEHPLALMHSSCTPERLGSKAFRQRKTGKCRHSIMIASIGSRQRTRALASFSMAASAASSRDWRISIASTAL